MRSLLACLFLVVATASPSFGAAVTFQGGINKVFPGALDPLGLGPFAPGNPRLFTGWLNTDATGTTVLNGAISFQTAPNKNFLFSGGTLSTGGGTTHFTNMVLAGAPAGTLMSFDFGVQIPDFVSQNSINQLRFQTGSITIEVGAIAQYTGTVTAVPEPASCIALLGCVAGGGLMGWRRRKKLAATA